MSTSGQTSARIRDLAYALNDHLHGPSCSRALGPLFAALVRLPRPRSVAGTAVNSSRRRYFPTIIFSYYQTFQSVAFGGLVMLDEEFKKQRARTVRDLAEKANDPFIKKRLQDLALRYEDDDPKTPTPLTPLDLQYESRGTGSER